MGYPEFLSFAVGVFSKKTGATRTGAQATMNVEFVNTYKAYRSKSARQGAGDGDAERAKEECRARVSYFAERFVEMVTGNIRGNKFALVDRLQRVVKTVLKRKALSLVESVMAGNSEAWFGLLGVEEPSGTDSEEYGEVLRKWEEVRNGGWGEEEVVDEFVKGILQNRILNEEICKLVIYVTSRKI